MNTIATKTRMGISEKEISTFEAGIGNNQDGKAEEYIRDTLIDSLIFDLDLTSEDIGLPSLPNKELLKLVWKAAELRGLSTNAYIRETLGTRWDSQDEGAVLSGRTELARPIPWHDRSPNIASYQGVSTQRGDLDERSFANILVERFAPVFER